MKCPVDGMTEIQEGESPCHQCGADLSFYWKVGGIPAALYDEALDCVEKKAWEEAVTKLHAAQVLSPPFWEASLLLGDVYRQMGRNGDALQQWEKALLLSPGNPGIVQRIAALKSAAGTTEARDSPAGGFHSPGIFLFSGGFTLFIVTALISLYGRQLHYADRQQTWLVLLFALTGVLLLLTGLNYLKKPEDRYHPALFLGILLAVAGITGFCLWYVDNWGFFVGAVCTVVLLGGFFLLVISLVLPCEEIGALRKMVITGTIAAGQEEPTIHQIQENQ
jgi:hypothetical protein